MTAPPPQPVQDSVAETDLGKENNQLAAILLELQKQTDLLRQIAANTKQTADGVNKGNK